MSDSLSNAETRVAARIISGELAEACCSPLRKGQDIELGLHKKPSKRRRDATRVQRYNDRQEIFRRAYRDYLPGPSAGLFPEQDPLTIEGRLVPPMPSAGEVDSQSDGEYLFVKVGDVLQDKKRRYEHPFLYDHEGR